MKYKKAIAAMAAISLLALTACGNDQSYEQTQQVDVAAAQTSAQSQTQAQTPEQTQTDAQTQTPGAALPDNMDTLIAENENLQLERDALSDILWDDALRQGALRRMVYVTDAKMEGEVLTVTLQTVSFLTGDAAVEAVMQDGNLSREQAEMEVENGYYIQETQEQGTFTVREGAIFYMEEPFSRMQMEGAEFLLWWGDEEQPWQSQLPYQALIYEDEVVLLQSYYLP